MKKVLISMLLLSMTFSFTACGGSKSDATSTQAASEDATDATNDDQAVVDADYNQILTFIEGLQNHQAIKEQLGTYRAQYDAGELTIDDLLASYQQLTDDSQLLLGQIQSAVWSSETYTDQITLLTEALEALAQAEALHNEAAINNDEDKLIEGDTYMNTYDEKFNAFLTAMGM